MRSKAVRNDVMRLELIRAFVRLLSTVKMLYIGIDPKKEGREERGLKLRAKTLPVAFRELPTVLYLPAGVNKALCLSIIKGVEEHDLFFNSGRVLEFKNGVVFQNSKEDFIDVWWLRGLGIHGKLDAVF